MIIDSIIFDLDGTLWNSAEGVVKSWNNALQGFEEVTGKLTIKDIEGVMGLQMDAIGEKLFPYLDREKQRIILEECSGIECSYLAEHGGILYDGLEETLITLSEKYKLFIVSNCSNGYIEAFYKYHKLEKYFIDFEHAGRTGLSKGENIKLVMERNHLDHSIYVGDTVGDQKAADFAGIPFIYARYGFGEVEAYDYAIDNIKALTKLI